VYPAKEAKLMRVLLVAVTLVLTTIAAAAGGPPNTSHCPIAYNPLYALTRYCESLREEIHGARKFCIYDCLIKKDAMIVASDQSCPLLAKQRIYGNGSTSLVMR
jgi:hypothetical protein